MRVNGLLPIRETFFIDRDVNPAVRHYYMPGPPDVHAYYWDYLVTAVFEKDDLSRVESSATHTLTIELGSCNVLNGTGPCNLCSWSEYENFPGGIEHEDGIMDPIELPPTPEQLTVNQGTTITGTDGSDAVVEISWSKPSDSSKVAGYYLYYKTVGEGDGSWRPVNGLLEDPEGDGTSTIGLTPAVIARFADGADTKIRWRHYRRWVKTLYRLKAVDQWGRVSPDADSSAAWPYTGVPECLNAKSQCGNGRVRLRWKENDDDDRSKDFNVYRRIMGTSSAYQLLERVTMGSTDGNGYWTWFDEPVDCSVSPRWQYLVRAVYPPGGAPGSVAEFESDGAEEDDDDDGNCPDDLARNEQESPWMLSELRPRSGASPVGLGLAPRHASSPPNSDTLMCHDVSSAAEPALAIPKPASHSDQQFAASAETPHSPLQEVTDAQLVSSLPDSTHIGSFNPPWEVSILWADHLGSTRVVSTITGNRITRHAYHSFGENDFGGAPDYATKEFTGHERDRETGLDYMFARYYGAGIGRFVSTDPIDGSPPDSKSFNKFTYVLNNPAQFVDPSGLYWAPCTPMPIIPGDPKGCTRCSGDGGSNSDGDGSSNSTFYQDDNGNLHFSDSTSVNAPKPSRTRVWWRSTKKCFGKHHFSTLFRPGGSIFGQDSTFASVAHPVAQSLEIVAPISLGGDMVATYAKSKGTQLGSQPYASGMNWVFRRVAQGLGSPALQRSLVGAGNVATKAFAPIGAFTLSYNATIGVECAFGMDY